MKHNPEVGATDDLSLRVSIATYNQVVFPHPQNGKTMLALERKATVLNDGTVGVQAQPFGGGIRILNPTHLQEIIGEFKFDSERSKLEGDFRILIPPFKWEMVKQYCLHHLENPDDLDLESTPYRELAEEFEETLNVNLKVGQYTIQPKGFVIQNIPVATENTHTQGQLTVRLYRLFEMKIIDTMLCKDMLAASERYSDQELGRLASKNFQIGGKGRVNSILTLPLNMVIEAYSAIAPELRYQKIVIEKHKLDESVLAVLDGVDVPQYKRA